MPTRLISQHEFDRRAGISQSTRKRLRQSDPTFPRLVTLSKNIERLVEEERDAWIGARIAERDRGAEDRETPNGEKVGAPVDPPSSRRVGGPANGRRISKRQRPSQEPTSSHQARPRGLQARQRSPQAQAGRHADVPC
jgi:predicted DNA-binding transcriptional regulator AlpA